MSQQKVTSTDLIRQAFQAVRRQNESTQSRTSEGRSKTSSAAVLSPHEQLLRDRAAKRKRNQQFLKMSAAQEQLALMGFQKVSMDSVGGKVGAEVAISPDHGVHGKPEPVPISSIETAIHSGENPDPTPGTNPMVARSGGGGEPPAWDSGNVATIEAPPGEPVRTRDSDRVPMHQDQNNAPDTMDGRNVESQASARGLLAQWAGRPMKDLNKARAYCSAQLNIHGPQDALYIFKRSGSHPERGLGSEEDPQTAVRFLQGLKLSSPNEGARHRHNLLNHLRAHANAYYQGRMDKTSMEGEVREEARRQVDMAKDVVEGAVKQDGTLPTTTQVATAANVSPMAANVAIFEVSEVIAATGGQVGAAGQASGAMPPAPVPAGMAPPPGAMPPMPPPPPGAPPMPPMPPGDPNMGGAPPMPPGDPSMGGAPPMPPGDPGMPVQSSARIHPRRFGAALSRIMAMGGFKISADTEVPGVENDADGPEGGPTQRLVEAGNGGTTSDNVEDGIVEHDTGSMLSDGQEAMLDSMLGTNDAVAQTDSVKARAASTMGDPSLTSGGPAPATTDLVNTFGESIGGSDGVDAQLPATASGPSSKTPTEPEGGDQSKRPPASKQSSDFKAALDQIIADVFKTSEESTSETRGRGSEGTDLPPEFRAKRKKKEGEDDGPPSDSDEGDEDDEDEESSDDGGEEEGND